MSVYARSRLNMISVIIFIYSLAVSRAEDVRSSGTVRVGVDSSTTMWCEYEPILDAQCDFVGILWKRSGKSGSIVFLKDNNNPQKNERVDTDWRMDKKYPRNTLTIVNVKKSDAGTYECHFMCKGVRANKGYVKLEVLDTQLLEFFDSEDELVNVGGPDSTEHDTLHDNTATEAPPETTHHQIITVSPELFTTVASSQDHASKKGEELAEDNGSSAVLTLCVLLGFALIMSVCAVALFLMRRKRTLEARSFN